MTDPQNQMSAEQSIPADVKAMLDAIEPESKREDAYALLRLFGQITGQPPKIWSGTMIGFGHWHYRYATGREGDTFLTGFAPRKQNLTIYLNAGLYQPESTPLLEKLGKHKVGKGCLYINKLKDVDVEALRALIKHSADYTAALQVAPDAE